MCKSPFPPISTSQSLMGSGEMPCLPLSSAAFLVLASVVVVNCITGPVSTVSKHISFTSFNPNENPRILHDLKLLGSTKLSEEQGMIQIPDTQIEDLKYKAGRAIYSSPVRLLDPNTQTPASFETTFSFQINPTTPGKSNLTAETSDSDGHGGSGLTFIIVPDEITVGRPGKWLGMLNDACDDDYKSFAIEFDTRQNLEFRDPNDNHVGINLGSIISSHTVDASDAGVDLKDGSVHRAWILYDGQRKFMDVRLGSDAGEFPKVPLFSAPLDLSDLLKEYMFVGFSASTGNLTQIHNIRTWNFSSTSQAHLRIPSRETCEQKLIVERAKTAKRETPSAFLVFIAVVVLCLVVVLNLYCNGKSRKKSPPIIAIPAKSQRPRLPHKPRRFTVSEVSLATRCFSEGEVLGSDEKGIFYRGTLPNGCHVAVKRFSTRFLNSPGIDRKRILKEIGAFSRVRHPNLVPIRGWCCEKREAMVIYDYLPNGSLDKWLFARGVLPWTRRLKVLKDVAEALCFLHGKKLGHKNVKTSSVLLDVTFRAVMGDFGFLSSPAESNRSESVDVFGFGILALEIVAGRPLNEDTSSGKEMDLLEFAWRMHENDELMKVVDRRMGAVYNSEQAVRVLEVGLLCTVNEAKGRPSMEDVVAFLNTERAITKLPPSRPVALFPYNSDTNICSIYSCAPFK